MNMIDRIPESRKERRDFQSKPTAFFQITAPDDVLRGLMAFIQSEGIITQNTISDSQPPGTIDRQFLLWVDAEDESKIRGWLTDNSFAG